MDKKLKKGDRVRIVATVDDIPRIREECWWNSQGEMIPSFGREGVAERICDGGEPVVVRTEAGHAWAWKLWALEKVDDMGTKKTRTAYLKAERVMDRGVRMFKMVGFGNVLTMPKAV